MGSEPLPNGGRINQGSDGGTLQATPSQPQLLQVLSPRPLDKLQVGQQENVTWQTGGLYAPANYYANTILGDQPLAYYRLDESSGTAATDSTSSGFNATYVGGVQLGQLGPLPFQTDTAVTLDGSTGYVQLPTLSNAFTGGFSAEVWAYPTSAGNYQTFLDLGNGPYADNIVLYRVGTTNNLAFAVYQSSSQGNVVVANNAITQNQWQYFAVTMDTTGNVTLYKNGVAIATGTANVPRSGITRADNYLGKSNFSATATLRTPAAWTRPPSTPRRLSAAQIAAHYAQHIYGTVNIDLLQNGTLVENIATNVPDSYSYIWTIPATCR